MKFGLPNFHSPPPMLRFLLLALCISLPALAADPQVDALRMDIQAWDALIAEYEQTTLVIDGVKTSVDREYINAFKKDNDQLRGYLKIAERQPLNSTQEAHIETIKIGMGDLRFKVDRTIDEAKTLEAAQKKAKGLETLKNHPWITGGVALAVLIFSYFTLIRPFIKKP